MVRAGQAWAQNAILQRVKIFKKGDHLFDFPEMPYGQESSFSAVLRLNGIDHVVLADSVFKHPEYGSFILIKNSWGTRLDANEEVQRLQENQNADAARFIERSLTAPLGYAWISTDMVEYVRVLSQEKLKEVAI